MSAIQSVPAERLGSGNKGSQRDRLRRGILCAAMCQLVLFLLVASLCLGATPTPPESVGMSAERLVRIGPMLQEYIDRGEIPGAVTLVARRGSVVHLEAHGAMSFDSGSPMTTDTIFGLASMTKPIVSVGAMILVEEGRLLLNDELGSYIPEFANPQVLLESGEKVAAKRPVLIRHLLTHTSGVSTTERDRYTYPTLADHIEAVVRLPLHFHPGERFRYPESAEVLGRVIEIVAGKTLKQFLHDRIFLPLSMPETHFGLPNDKKGRQAMYVRDGKEDPTYGGHYPGGVIPTKYFSGRGGLFSTAEDYWRFCQMLLDGGKLDGRRIISRPTVEQMTQPMRNPPDLPGWTRNGQFRLGFRVTTDRAAEETVLSNGSFGWGGAYGTIFSIDPKEELVVVLMTQVRGILRSRIPGRFRRLAYAAIGD